MSSAERPLLAIDGRVLKRNQAGRARYTQRLVEAWIDAEPQDRVVVYLPKPEVRAAIQFPRSWEQVTAPDSIWGSWQVVKDARRRHIEAMLAPTNYSLGALCAVPTVPIVYDLAALYLADHRPSLRIWLPELLMMQVAVRRATAIIAISQFTQDELVRRYPLTAAKTKVVYGGVEDRFFAPPSQHALTAVRHKYQLPGQFLLFVGTLEPRKNLVRLLDAFGRLPAADQRRFPLYLAGNLGWSHGPILSKLADYEARGVVRRLGYVDDPDLPLLYHLAYVTVYPSLYEGFGLPALEALAAGGVVLTSDTSSLPEVVGKAALAIDPRSVAAIKGGLTKLIHDGRLRTRLKRSSVHQARRFDWPTSARQTREILIRVAKTARRTKR